MPQKPPSICPRCRTVKRGRCPKCYGGKQYGWQDDKIRGSRIERGYDQDWIKLRETKLTVNPWCEYCLQKEPEMRTLAKEVHHVIAFKGVSDPLRLEWTNLASVCVECHGKKTGRTK